MKHQLFTLPLLVAAFFICVCSTFARQPVNAIITPLEIMWVSGCHPPLSASEPKRAFGCKPTGGETITIRGRNFGRAGAAVALVLPRPVAAKKILEEKGSGKNGPIQQEQQQQQKSDILLPCKETRHSDSLPSILLFCKLPAFEPEQQQQQPAASKNLFEKTVGAPQQQQQEQNTHHDDGGNSNLKLISQILERSGSIQLHVAVTTNVNTPRGIQQQTALLRNAVTVMSGADGTSPTSTSKQQKNLEKLVTIDWKSIGVGGLTKEVKQLIRRVISTRANPKAVKLMGELGISHVKGVLLYGLPGTGKTLLAKKIAEHLGAQHVTVVNGPSLVSKFVGESEKNLRELFSPAESDWQRFGSLSPLHVIILDEVDAIMKPRHNNEDTSSGATAIYDGLTTQMLAAMDGLESVGNVLVFALTNRKDALDNALLRPGRFEVQLHLPLPAAKSRREIFEIHSAKLEKAKMLHDDVDYVELSELTPSFSGADIAGVVRSAVSFSLHRMAERIAREVDQEKPASSASYCSSASSTSACSSSSTTQQEGNKNNNQDEEEEEENKKNSKVDKVTMKDFVTAIGEVRATKGSAAADTPARLLRRGIVPTAVHTPVIKRLSSVVKDFVALPPKSFFRVLLHGAPEAGLTSIASSVCTMHAGFDSVHIIRSESVQHLSADKTADMLSKALTAAREANNACLVIDGADQIAAAGEAVKGGGVASSLSTSILKIMRQMLLTPVDDTLEDASAEGGGGGGGGAASKKKKTTNRNSDNKIKNDPDNKAHQEEDQDDDDEVRTTGRVLVVVTVQSLSFIRSLAGSNALFDTEEHVALLGSDDVARILLGYGVFPATDWKQAKNAAASAIATDIPVKRLLRAVDVVRAKMLPAGSAAALPCRSRKHALSVMNRDQQQQQQQQQNSNTDDNNKDSSNENGEEEGQGEQNAASSSSSKPTATPLVFAGGHHQQLPMCEVLNSASSGSSSSKSSRGGGNKNPGHLVEVLRDVAATFHINA